MLSTTLFLNTELKKPTVLANTSSEPTTPNTDAKTTPSITPKSAVAQNVQKAVQGSIVGTGFLGMTVPWLLPCYSVSAFSCRFNTGPVAATQEIYEGVRYGTSPSLSNFTRGTVPYVGRELVRIWAFKGVALAEVKPWLAEQKSLTPRQQNVIWAGGLSAADTIVSPLDALRVRLQSGKSWKSSLKEYTYGAGTNSLRQMLIWTTYGETETRLNELLKQNGINPHTVFAAAAKAPVEAVAFTYASYWLEPIKNRLQYDSEHYSQLKPGQFKIIEAAKDIKNQQGITAIYRGVMAKTLGNFPLAFFATLLTEVGKNMGKGDNILENISEGFKKLQIR